MAIVLGDASYPAVTRYAGMDTVVLPAGKTIKVETSPDGEEILNEEVPVGKSWTIQITVYVIEENA